MINNERRIDMDTYIKFNDGYAKLGLLSLGSSEEKVIREKKALFVK